MSTNVCVVQTQLWATRYFVAAFSYLKFSNSKLERNHRLERSCPKMLHANSTNSFLLTPSPFFFATLNVQPHLNLRLILLVFPTPWPICSKEISILEVEVHELVFDKNRGKRDGKGIIHKSTTTQHNFFIPCFPFRHPLLHSHVPSNLTF